MFKKLLPSGQSSIVSWTYFIIGTLTVAISLVVSLVVAMWLSEIATDIIFDRETKRGSDTAIISDTEFAERAKTWLLNNPEVMLEALAVLESREAQNAAAIDGETITAEQAAIFNNPKDGFVGSGNNVVAVEFLDYQCGFCKRQVAAVKAFIDANPDKKIILKEFPILGPGSELAARAALATKILEGNDAYLNLHNQLLGHQGQITGTILDEMLISAGADPAAVRERMTHSDITTHIESNRALAQRLGINGTPAFVFKDSIERGLLSLDALEAKGS